MQLEAQGLCFFQLATGSNLVNYESRLVGDSIATDRVLESLVDADSGNHYLGSWPLLPAGKC